MEGERRNPGFAVRSMLRKKIDIHWLEQKAKEIRKDILVMLNKAGSGHTGGSLSACDLVTAIFFAKLRHHPADPSWEDRDRFVLSKGHAAPLLYATLAHAGYFDRKELSTLRRLGSRLQGHTEYNLALGVESSAGSLGQGLSLGNGMALALKLNKRKSRVYVLVSDGDVQEGQLWEAAITSSHRRLDNICLIIDNNDIQLDGHIREIRSTIYPLVEKFQAFGWQALEIDGHDFKQILDALNSAEAIKGKPTAIVAKTIKGKGVSIFEGQVKYHGIAPSDEELALALKELGD